MIIIRCGRGIIIVCILNKLSSIVELVKNKNKKSEEADRIESNLKRFINFRKKTFFLSIYFEKNVRQQKKSEHIQLEL